MKLHQSFSCLEVENPRLSTIPIFQFLAGVTDLAVKCIQMSSHYPEESQINVEHSSLQLINLIYVLKDTEERILQCEDEVADDGLLNVPNKGMRYTYILFLILTFLKPINVAAI